MFLIVFLGIHYFVDCHVLGCHVFPVVIFMVVILLGIVFSVIACLILVCLDKISCTSVPHDSGPVFEQAEKLAESAGPRLILRESLSGRQQAQRIWAHSLDLGYRSGRPMVGLHPPFWRTVWSCANLWINRYQTSTKRVRKKNLQGEEQAKSTKRATKPFSRALYLPGDQTSISNKVCFW